MFVLTKSDIQHQKSEICCIIEDFGNAYMVLLNKLQEFKGEFSVKSVERERVEVFQKCFLYGSTLVYVFEIHNYSPA